MTRGDEEDVKRDMAIARRMLASEFPWENLTTQFGARVPGEAAFWIVGPECPEGALPEDASKVGFDGRVLLQGAEPVARAGLHAAIFRARPDVGGICITSSPSHAALASHTAPLATYYQYGGIFYQRCARVSLDCELDSPAGEAAAVKALGTKRALFIAGWGAINVSETLRYAFAEANCLMLSSTREIKALRIGGAPMSHDIACSYQSNYLKPDVQFRMQMWLAAERRMTAGAPEVFGATLRR
ncbi:MAG: class II aldolase/adducin family protein [Betaproteobacteria bacterium]|nr:class II aldolase/adducin family protein [Betaproteobacteria bacterium]